MYMLKGCTRCSGDLYQESDQFGPYVACVQCGYEPTEYNQAPAGGLQAMAEQSETQG